MLRPAELLLKVTAATAAREGGSAVGKQNRFLMSPLGEPKVKQEQ